MQYLALVTNFIISLKPKEFDRYMIIVLGAITLIVVGSSYYIYSAASTQVEEIKKLNSLASKSAQLLIESEAIQLEEDRIAKLLSENEDFSIKSYFEQFCRTQGIVPDDNWDTTINPIEGNEKFDEIILAASFRNQTTKKLVEVLDILDKNEIVYVTELKIRREKQKRIGFDLVIATKKPRLLLEE